MWVSMCMHCGGVWVCEGGYRCTCPQSLEVELSCLPQLLFILFFETCFYFLISFKFPERYVSNFYWIFDHVFLSFF